jgi:hypothetical protein
MDTHQQLIINQPLQKLNKYMPLAVLYFFFNSLWLPEGLLYTTLLTPYFIVWLYQNKMLHPFAWFACITLGYALIHLVIGIDILYYLRSYLLFSTVFIFVLTIYMFTRVCLSPGEIFKKLLILNFFLLIPASIAFFIPGIRDIFWMTSDVSSGLADFSRLKMFTYEASYYSLLLVPIAFYYLLKVILYRVPNKGLILLLIALPLTLSFAFGVLLGIPITIVILYLSDIRLLYLKRGTKKLLIISFIFLVLSAFLFARLYPDNPLFLRIANIIQGRDSSFKGRVFESIYLAYEVVKEKSLLFGAGLGQYKLLAKDLMSNFYSYTTEVDIVRLSSTVSETFATFGLTGLFVRFIAEVYLFFKTRVYTNYYRLALFIFIFIYQFTGSYLMNIAEYVVWVFAFSKAFPEFNKVTIHENSLA